MTYADIWARFEPITPPTETLDDDGYTVTEYVWASDADDLIAEFRTTDPALDAALTLAERGGTSIVDTWHAVEGKNEPHPLLGLSRNGGDEDFFVITNASAYDTVNPADMIAERLAPCCVETHRTPAWVVRITCHA